MVCGLPSQKYGEESEVTIDGKLLSRYKNLLETTDLQRSYQEFIRFFRCLRTELEDQLPDYKFQSDIVASAMDYSYFSFTQPQLRANGLKFVVVFVHASFQLEIWISGYNRNFQSFWSKQLDIPFPFIPSVDPSHTDYIARIPVAADVCACDTVLPAVKDTLEKCVAFLAPYLTALPEG